MLICCEGAKVPLGIINQLPFTTTWLFTDTDVYNLNWVVNGQFYNVQINGAEGQPLIIPNSFFANGGNVLQLVNSSGVLIACFNACIAIGNQYVHTPELEPDLQPLECGEAPPVIKEQNDCEPCNFCQFQNCNCHD